MEYLQAVWLPICNSLFWRCIPRKNVTALESSPLISPCNTRSPQKRSQNCSICECYCDVRLTFPLLWRPSRLDDVRRSICNISPLSLFCHPLWTYCAITGYKKETPWMGFFSFPMPRYGPLLWLVERLIKKGICRIWWDLTVISFNFDRLHWLPPPLKMIFVFFLCRFFFVPVKREHRLVLELCAPFPHTEQEFFAGFFYEWRVEEESSEN